MKQDTLLWIDEELDQWLPTIKPIAAACGLVIRPQWTIRGALEDLAKAEPRIILLDMITQRGGAIQGIEGYGRYTGLAVLERFPLLRWKMIAFSIVTQGDVGHLELIRDVPWFNKVRPDLTGLQTKFAELLEVRDDRDP